MFRLSVVCLNFKIVDFIKDGMTSPLPPALVSFFHSRGIFTWDKLIKSWSYTTPVWKDEADFFASSHSVVLELCQARITGFGHRGQRMFWPGICHALLLLFLLRIYMLPFHQGPRSQTNRFSLSHYGKSPVLSRRFSFHGSFSRTEILHGRCYRRRAGRVRDDALCVRTLKSQTSICSFNVLSLNKSGMNFFLGFPPLWFFLCTGRFFLVE